MCFVVCLVGDSLRGNHLTIAAFAAGELGTTLPRLNSLVAIDLRENDLCLCDAANLRQVMSVINQLPQLRSLGICGNWDGDDRHWYVGFVDKALMTAD